MNLLFLWKHEIDHQGSACIRGSRVDHVVNILKKEEGALIRVGIIDAYVGSAVITHIFYFSPDSSDTSSAIIQLQLVHSPLCIGPLPEQQISHHITHLDILVGLPRPKFLDRILQTAATLGVRRIMFVVLERSELAYLSSSKLNRQSIENSLILGLEQAAYHAGLPEVHVYASLKKCLDDVSKESSAKFVFHRDAQIKSLADCQKITSELPSIMLAFGSERGFLDDELKQLEQADFNCIGLGPRVLRVETAIVTAIAQLRLVQQSTDLEPIAWKAPFSCWCKIAESSDKAKIHLPVRGPKQS